MLSANIQNIVRAEPSTVQSKEPFDTVTLITERGNACLFLPAGTAAAVADCINAAIAIGERGEKIAALKAKWNRVCEAMNVGSWNGSEAEALAEIERIKSQISELEQADA